MNSYGHRLNILSDFEELGVGVAIASLKDFKYRPYYTQLFITTHLDDREDYETIDDKSDFDNYIISEKARKDSVIYNYNIDSNGSYPEIIDIEWVELVFFQDMYNFNIKLRDIPEEIIINNNDLDLYDIEYQWAVIIQDDTTEYKFFCENLITYKNEQLVPVKDLRKYFTYDIYSKDIGEEYYGGSSGVLELQFDFQNNMLSFVGLKPWNLNLDNIRSIKIIAMQGTPDGEIINEYYLK